MVLGEFIPESWGFMPKTKGSLSVYHRFERTRTNKNVSQTTNIHKEAE